MSEPKPWTLLVERHQRDYRIFKTRTFDAADPRNGKAYIRTVIDATDWVNVVATTVEGHFILVRQFRFGLWANTLEIPGGMIDPGEEAQAGAARELEEETGYRPGKISLIGISHPNPAIQSNRLFTYRAEQCVKVSAGHQDGSEDIAVEVKTREEVKQAVKHGEVTHSLVLTALYWDSIAE